MFQFAAEVASGCGTGLRPVFWISQARRLCHFNRKRSMKPSLPKNDDRLTPSQRQAVTARGNVLVMAGAGTGKTHTLVERCLHCLCAEQPPASLEEILVVTFTEAAAAEMRRRLREQLEEKLRAAPDEPRWTEQIALFDTAHIGTLHGFCLKLVREHFHELGLDPQLAVLDEGEARLLADETLDEELQEHYAGQNELAEAVQKLIQIYGGGRDQAIRHLVLRLHNYAQTRPDADGWLARQIETFSAPEPVVWKTWLLDAISGWCDEWLPVLQNLKAENEKAAELAKQANDELAELVLKYRDRFCGPVATLALNNVDEALKEADRAINDLKMRGVYIHTPVDEKPLDNPEFWPLYEKMEKYDLPIVIHPMRKEDHPDFLTEKVSKYFISSLFGWPYDTTTAMARLVFSGVMQKHPNLKILTHHLGGMVPFYSERIKQFTQSRLPPGLRKDAIDYFKMFYADTGIYGNPSALKCGFDFFGRDHIVFGVDFPLGDIEHGTRNYRQTINAIEEMGITEADKKLIYEDNARNLMHLPV